MLIWIRNLGDLLDPVHLWAKELNPGGKQSQKIRQQKAPKTYQTKYENFKIYNLFDQINYCKNYLKNLIFPS